MIIAGLTPPLCGVRIANEKRSGQTVFALSINFMIIAMLTID
jgi:hypothetical protein